jgi:hypothetical protein
MGLSDFSGTCAALCPPAGLLQPGKFGLAYAKMKNSAAVRDTVPKRNGPGAGGTWGRLTELPTKGAGS